MKRIFKVVKSKHGDKDARTFRAEMISEQIPFTNKKKKRKKK